MRTTRSGGGRPGGLIAALLLALLVAALAGCSSGHDQPLLGDRQPVVSIGEAQHVLDQRAAAILDGNLRQFLRSVDSSDHELVARQRRYFANLRQLPVERLAYTVLKSDWPEGLRSTSWGPHVSVPQVRVALQLRDFDTVPVQRVTGFAFAHKGGRTVIVSDVTGAGKPFPGSNPAPWELVRIHVRRDVDTLQLYDDRTWRRAGLVSSTLRDGIASVSSALPFGWDDHAVVYVFSRPVVLNSFDGVPGGNITHLGAMTFPMYAVLGQPAVAGIRFMLLPSSLRAGPAFLGRIVRHELTHVALGQRDDGVPTWFAEGIAEYMGARDIPQDQRRIATVAVARAREGVDALPPSRGFNGDDQAWHYALSWMACDYIAATRGESRLWDLMDALHAGGAGTPDADQDAVLERVVGLSGAELARHAATRILRIYG
jgi:hypothetical protein